MANLVSAASGNLTAAGTWQICDTTSFLQTQTNTQTTSNSFTSSSAFTPGAITIDALGVYLATRSAVPTGTFSVRLAIAGIAVTGTTVTANVTDIDNATTNGLGWYCFKFAAPVTLLAATAYTIQAMSSTSAQVTMYRDATANNICRFLRTTTTQAPVAADNLLIMGNYTAATIGSSYVVTMNDTAGVFYGNVEVSKNGTLTCGTTAATAYTLKPAGNILIWPNGTLNTGTSGTPMPASSSLVIEFQCTSPVQYGLTVSSLGVWNSFGNALTTDRAMLAADAAAAATSLTLNTTTNWKSGDLIAVASSTLTTAQSEEVALGADAVGTSLPTIGALGFAHSGTGAIAAEVINLTRNVYVKGIVNITPMSGYVNILNSSIVNVQWTQFAIMGSATANKTGFDIGTTTGSCTVQNCAFHDNNIASAICVKLNLSTNNNINVSNNVFYNTQGSHLTTTAAVTTGLSITISNNIAIKNAAGPIFNFQNCKIIAQNNTAISGTTSGFVLSDTTYDGTGLISGVAHSNTTLGVAITGVSGVAAVPAAGIGSFTVWRNNTYGIGTSGTSGIKIDGVTAFGNLTANIGSNGQSAGIYWNNVTANAGTIQIATVGFGIGGYSDNIYLDNSSFGATTNHVTGDISFNVASEYAMIIARNTTFSSATTVGQQANMVWPSMVRIQRLNGTAGNHKTFMKYGTVILDTVIFNMGTKSTRLTPNSANVKLESGPIKFDMASGQVCTFQMFIRKSVVGDGTAYNGNQPRLIQKANPALGINSSIVLATATNAANGTFVAFMGTTTAPTDDGVIECVIDCDGTQGWINIDDSSIFGIPQFYNAGSQNFWDNGLPATTLPPPIATARLARGLIL